GKFDGEGRASSDWHSRTWKETRDEAINMAKGLIVLGLNKGDRVVIFSESRPRWIIADQAIQACGAIGVPLYPTLTLEELKYMTQDSGARIVIVSDQDKGEMTLHAKAQGVPVENIITMGTWNGDKPEGIYTFNDVMILGKQNKYCCPRRCRFHNLYIGNYGKAERRHSHPEKLDVKHSSMFQFHAYAPSTGLGASHDASCPFALVSCFRQNKRLPRRSASTGEHSCFCRKLRKNGKKHSGSQAQCVSQHSPVMGKNI